MLMKKNNDSDALEIFLVVILTFQFTSLEVDMLTSTMKIINEDQHRYHSNKQS